jgi:four helix bundle protein
MGEQAASHKGLENLLAWQRGMQLAARVYNEVIPCLPAEEKWAMALQLRRASVSIPANIAEGYGRFYFQEAIRFCYIARGSLEEVRTFLALAKDVKYLDAELYASLSADTQDLRKILGGYIAYLKTSKPGQHEPGAQRIVKEDSAVYSMSETDWEDQFPAP